MPNPTRGQRPSSQKTAGATHETTWDLRLYVADDAPTSIAALANLKQLCQQHLKGRYRIQVIDLVAHPQFACRDNIVAIPTLIRKRPLPIKIAIGKLTDPERVRTGLGIPFTSPEKR